MDEVVGVSLNLRMVQAVGLSGSLMMFFSNLSDKLFCDSVRDHPVCRSTSSSGALSPSPSGTVSRSAIKCNISYIKIRCEEMDLEVELQTPLASRAPSLRCESAHVQETQGGDREAATSLLELWSR